VTDVRFDHTIIAAKDKNESARFFTEIFGLPEPQESGFFLTVYLSDGRVLDFAEPPIDFPGQHYAFQVNDETFDGIMERIRARCHVLGRSPDAEAR
jgi:catechol 2,3-dioxygenase-like lactoylglutathione lyase family enzyme